MTKLKPNSKAICIAETHDFTVGKIYEINSSGIILDDDGYGRVIISEEDEYFFDLFKYVD